MEKELQILNDELLKKDKMLNRACEMLEMGIYTLEKYQSRLNILENEKKALQEQINALNNNDIDKVKQVKLAVPVLEQCVASYWTLEAKQKNDLLKSIISKIEYSKSNLTFDKAFITKSIFFLLINLDNVINLNLSVVYSFFSKTILLVSAKIKPNMKYALFSFL